MDEPIELFTPENPSYQDRVQASMNKHPAGKHMRQHLTPILQASGVPKPVKTLKRVK